MNKLKFRTLTYSATVLFTLLILLAFGSCELIDPTEVRNPQITDESFVGQRGSMAAARQGARFRFAQMLDNYAYFTDVVSDNYDNVATFISPNADNPRAIRWDDLTLNGVNSLYRLAQTLRAEINFAITQVAPQDPDQALVPPMVAELQFYRGVATLILAENFTHAPSTSDGPAETASALLAKAVVDLQAAVAGSPALPPLAARHGALARAYRMQGNATLASSSANDAIAAGATFVFTQGYDAATNTNDAWVFAVARALNDVQPLPRLDFLDPKYTDATGISPIAVVKAEEMHLILAEAAISGNDLATARTEMTNAITVAMGTTAPRNVVNFLDNDNRRDATNTPDARPNRDTLLVRDDATDTPRANHIFRRQGRVVAIKQISNTRITAADVAGLATANVEEHVRMLYKLRQEIFFFEGRRMSDLGIRLPIVLAEIENNPSINLGDPGTTVTVPAYIPPGSELDGFTVDAPSGVVTMLHDMNRIIAQNRATVSPFPMP